MFVRMSPVTDLAIQRKSALPATLATISPLTVDNTTLPRGCCVL
jgi:hypothetical protein